MKFHGLNNTARNYAVRCADTQFASLIRFGALRGRGLSMAAVVGLALALNGCTTSSPVPPLDLASVITPTDQDKGKDPAKTTTPDSAGDPAVLSTSGKPVDISTPKKTKPKAVAKSASTTPSLSALAPAKENEPKAQIAARSTTLAPATQPKQAQQKSAPKKDGSLLGLWMASSGANGSSGSAAGTPASNKPSSPTKATKQKPTLVASTRAGSARNGDLPGVKVKQLFNTSTAKPRRALDERKARPKKRDRRIRVASVATRAVRGNHGLILQRPNVKVGCFPPRLLRLLRQVERHFGRKVIVTSGFRSVAHNRRIRGARNSTHTRCLAADIQVKGVSKWRMARYLRSLPGRGGVGTYCWTKSVHIDIGKKRSWNYCNRRRAKKRRRS